jgi:methionine synthase I (cobalamin-dependent)
VFDYQALDFESLVKSLAGYPSMMMNIMHTPIADVDEALSIVKQYWDGAIGIYPESGYFTMPNWQFVDVIEPDDLAELAQTWIGKGVRMVGGCCGLGPEHIAALRQALN